VFAGSSGISSFDGSKSSIEMQLSSVHRGVSDTVSSAVNCPTVHDTIGSLSDDMACMSQASVIYSGASDELMTLVTPVNQMTGSVASTPFMQTPSMTEQLLPVDDAPCRSASLVQICVFSTELANCAAESVRIGHYNSIIDYHHDCCAVPVSQVWYLMCYC